MFWNERAQYNINKIPLQIPPRISYLHIIISSFRTNQFKKFYSLTLSYDSL